MIMLPHEFGYMLRACEDIYFAARIRHRATVVDAHCAAREHCAQVAAYLDRWIKWSAGDVTDGDSRATLNRVYVAYVNDYQAQRNVT